MDLRRFIIYADDNNKTNDNTASPVPATNATTTATMNSSSSTALFGDDDDVGHDEKDNKKDKDSNKSDSDEYFDDDDDVIANLDLDAFTSSNDTIEDDNTAHVRKKEDNEETDIADYYSAQVMAPAIKKTLEEKERIQKSTTLSNKDDHSDQQQQTPLPASKKARS